MYKSILKRVGIFDFLDESELSAMSSTASKIEYPAGSMIIHEGDIGQELYVILNGTVSIFKKGTNGHSGQEVVLAEHKDGQYFGEQAILPDGNQRRTANVRAITDVALLRITKDNLQTVLSDHNPLKEHLQALGREQTHQSMIRQSTLFRAVPFEDFVSGLYTEVTFKGGEIIFREGDPGDSLYFIAAGTVGVYREEASGQRLLVRLHEGQCFGELALLEQDPRSATAIAEGDVTTLQVDGKKFVELYQKTPDLQEYMQTLQRAYLVQGRGFVTQHSGKFLDMDAVTTVFHLIDGSTAIASTVIGENIFNMTFSDSDQLETETIQYQDKDTGAERDLVIADNQIVSLTSRGTWPELGQIHHLILQRTPLSAEQFKSFKQTGSLDVKKETVGDDEQVVCHCLQVKRGTLRTAIENGANTVQALADATGASTVCGSCTIHLREMVGDANWIPVSVSKVIRVTDNIRTFRFKPPTGMDLKPALAGQHVLVQAKIGADWVERPYTLSSACDETQFREITVKREAGGLFSNWLFDERQPTSLVRLSDPQGNYYVDLDKQNLPLVFFVAGIGMTPALAMARSIANKQSGQTLYVDYTASNWKQFAYTDELRNLEAENSNFTIKFRETSKDGRLDLEGVQQLVHQYPNAVFYICGPHVYQNAIQLYLTQSNVHAGRINVEEFTSAGQQDTVGTAQSSDIVNRLSTGKGYIVLGVLLVIAFLLQDWLQIKSEWLESIQSGETYIRWTGWLLAGYMLYQTFLPALRLFGYSKEKMTIQHYHFHKLAGVLAPLVFYIHSTKLGYAYLFVLSVVYFANVLMAYLNKDIFEDEQRKQDYTFYWMPTHVSLSVLTITLVLYHIYVVYAYQ